MNFLIEETIPCSGECRFLTRFVIKAIKGGKSERGLEGKERLVLSAGVEFSPFSY